jgi:hypothetical protein
MGLLRLREACEIALREGQYHGNDLGEFVGVKKLESAWFKSPKDSKPTRLANWALGPILLVLLGLVVIGAITVVQWLSR